MDRLVIESIFEETDQIEFQEVQAQSGDDYSIILGFKAAHSEQVISAFQELKKLGNDISLQICQTLVQGIYDLEIQMRELDEPVRISNKVIPAATLEQLTSKLKEQKGLKLGSNVAGKDYWLNLNTVEIKDCVR